MGAIGTDGKAHSSNSGSASGSATVVRIAAIEGLRAWLARAVVFYHLSITTNIDAHYGIVAKAEMIGSGAVMIFMMLSGFVITGLLLTRKEAWLPFITRRAFRLFPAYWIALALGAIAMLTRPYVFADVSWASDPAFVADMAYHATNHDAVFAAPLEQTLFHVALLQGAPPPAYMPQSATTILGPAWSLTVEWQFYLVAPFVVWMARKQIRAVTLVIAAAILVFGMQRGWMSDWVTTASLPNFLYVFVIGIFCRIALPYLPRHDGFGWAAAAAIVAIGVQTGIAPAIAIWLAFVMLIARTPENGAERTRAGLLDRVFAAAFESPLATYLGERSYSVYILHSPILVFAGYVLFPMYDFTREEALVAMTLVIVPTILIASDLMYRFVERPMIRIGARVADRLGIATANPVLLKKRVAQPVSGGSM
jgi:peptidoglycan/LPS O-acetylase OafA/YrhL